MSLARNEDRAVSCRACRPPRPWLKSGLPCCSGITRTGRTCTS